MTCPHCAREFEPAVVEPQRCPLCFCKLTGKGTGAKRPGAYKPQRRPVVLLSRHMRPTP